LIRSSEKRYRTIIGNSWKIIGTSLENHWKVVETHWKSHGKSLETHGKVIGKVIGNHGKIKSNESNDEVIFVGKTPWEISHRTRLGEWLEFQP
jgi:hypothetical protein